GKPGPYDPPLGRAERTIPSSRGVLRTPIFRLAKRWSAEHARRNGQDLGAFHAPDKMLNRRPG
ncbi:MAG TPA: hypothetical protein VKP69_21230, partial [Isosphaeraceae bacterium]|nr:hypothetical protein [Isosphaeraceae bacterium]